MRDNRVWAAFALLAGVLAAAWLLPVSAQPKPELPARPTVEELAKEVAALRGHLDALHQNDMLLQPAYFLQGDWTLTESKGDKPGENAVTGLSFAGQRVVFHYRDARGDRTYTFRADPGIPLPTLDIYESAGTVTLAAFSIGESKTEEVEDEFTVLTTEMRTERREGKDVQIPVAVPRKQRVKMRVTYGTELRLAIDKGSGLRPVDLSGKDAGCVAWVLKRVGGYRPAPRPETPPLPFDVPAAPATMPTTPPGGPSEKPKE